MHVGLCVGVCGSILIHPQIPAGCHLKKKTQQFTHQKLEQLEENPERSTKALQVTVTTLAAWLI